MRLWSRATGPQARASFARVAALALIALTALAGCRSATSRPASPPGTEIGSMTLTSTSFPNNGAIPVDCTCDGAGKSPGLTWSAPPERTRSLALILDDQDAPSGGFTHWIEYNIGPDALALPEGADPSALGATSATNDFQRVGYGAPCPPRMEIHHYAFHLLALDTVLALGPGATRDTIDRAMNGHLLAEGILVGVFSH
jgi:Raf kinase inhibitor-like YbhB/YbcL family protein